MQQRVRLGEHPVVRGGNVVRTARFERDRHRLGVLERRADALQVGESAGVHDRRRRLRVAPKARAPFDDRERQYRIEQGGAHQGQDALFGQPRVAATRSRS